MDIGLFPIRGNLFAGASSGISNTTGIHNTALGYSALHDNTTGDNNTTSGYEALFSNTTGHDNAASGSYALYSNTEGVYNSASGSYSLYKNTTAYQNTALGYRTLYFNTAGNSNTATGANALYSNTEGSANSGFGAGALNNNTTGAYNTACGHFALLNSSIGSYNTAVGANAGTFNSANLFNLTALGYDVKVEASNTARVGNTSVISIGGQVGWTTFSDGRYKKNVKENVAGLAFINSLKPVTYTVDVEGLNEYYDTGKENLTVHQDEKVSAERQKAEEKVKAEMDKSAEEASKIIYNGFIAQEVEEAAKKLNFEFSGVDKPQNKDGIYGIRYAEFVVPLVKAVQELSKMNDEKDALIAKQQQTLNEVMERLSLLEKQSGIPGTNQLSNTISSNSVSLEQNIPNPFSNTTTISYNLPPTFISAKLIVTDKMGKILKELNVSGSGKGSLKIDTSTLSSGAYQYSLYVDGRLVDTKQMELLK
jgi:hypothetical protein